MEVLSDEFRFFCDSTNFQNSIWMMYGPFIELDKHQASQYLRLVETERKQIQIRKGIQFKRLENKFLQAPNSKIIKIKYRLSNTNGPMFITSYLVSTKYRTFSLNVQHVNNIDFEEMIKHFDVK